MPQVQYRNEFRQQSITKGMHAPKKKVCELSSWLKAARRLIPEIPEDGGDLGWTLKEQVVDLKWIKFTLVNNVGERAYVVINRQANALMTF